VHLVQAAREAARRMLSGHPAAAEKHVARWLGGRADYLLA
jgi:ATP-dependent DNA helicase RecG